jgi:hypothetical protein
MAAQQLEKFTGGKCLFLLLVSFHNSLFVGVAFSKKYGYFGRYVSQKIIPAKSNI